LEFLYIYLILINAAALCLMGVDKWKAVRHRWRIPEKTLFLFACLGGSAGMLVGMYLFRHKVRVNLFRFGVPAVLILQAVLFALLSRPSALL